MILRSSLLAIAVTGTLASPALAAPKPKPGKYGCSESVLSVSDGTFSFEPRGFIRLFPNGTYRQNKGRTGTWSFKHGRTRFKRGDLAGSSAKAIDGKATRFQIRVQLSDDTAKWSCSRVGKAGR